MPVTPSKIVTVPRMLLGVLLAFHLLVVYALVINFFDVRDAHRRTLAEGASLNLVRSERPAETPTRLVQTLRAFRTHDNVVTRGLLRQAYRDLRYGQLVVPWSHGALGIHRINPAGTHAIVFGDEPGGAGDPNVVDVYDLTASPPTATQLSLPDREGTLWVGTDQLAARDGAGIGVWDLDTGRRSTTIGPEVLGLADGDPTALFSDVRGRWLGWTLDSGRRVRVVDLAEPTAVREVELPDQPEGGAWLSPEMGRPPDSEFVYLQGLTPAGEVAIWHGDTLVNLSPDGAERVPDPPPGYPASADGRPALVRCMSDGKFRLTSVVTGETIAEQAKPWSACEEADSAAFSHDGQHVAVVSSSLEMLHIGHVGGKLRGIPVSWISRVDSVVPEAGGGYRVILQVEGAMVLLRIPPADALDNALGDADAAMMSADGSHLLLQRGDRLESWDPTSRQRLGATTVAVPGDLREGGSWKVRQSSDGRLLATVPYGSSQVELFSLPDLAPVGSFEPPGLGNETQLADIDPDGRLLVKRALSYSAWSPTGEPLSAELQIPVLAPGGIVVLRPGHNEVVAIADQVLRRFRFADGAEIPGSQVALGEGFGGTGVATTIAMDNGGRYFAIQRHETLEVWDFDSGDRAGQLPLTQYWRRETAHVAGFAFGDDPHTLRIAAGAGPTDHGPHSSLPDRLSSLAWTWRDTLLRHRLIPWVEFPSTHWLPADESAPWALRENRAYRFELEPADPAVWLRRVCDVLAANPPPPDSVPPPQDVYDGPVCAAGP